MIPATIDHYDDEGPLPCVPRQVRSEDAARLARALIAQAVEDLAASSPKQWKPAAAWMASDDDRPASFAWCCLALDVVPGRMAARMWDLAGDLADLAAAHRAAMVARGREGQMELREVAA